MVPALLPFQTKLSDGGTHLERVEYLQVTMSELGARDTLRGGVIDIVIQFTKQAASARHISPLCLRQLKTG